MIRRDQKHAARALVGLEQAGLSLPITRRMVATGWVIRGTFDSLTKLIDDGVRLMAPP